MAYLSSPLVASTSLGPISCYFTTSLARWTAGEINYKDRTYDRLDDRLNYVKFPLVLLAPRSAHTRPSDWLPIATSGNWLLFFYSGVPGF